MRRILIDDKLTQLVEEYSQQLFCNRNRNFDQPVTRLGRLLFFLRMKGYDRRFSDYIDNLRYHYKSILKLKPDEFDDWQQDYFSFLNEPDMHLEIEVEDNDDDKIYKLPVCKRPFNEWVIWAMRYDELREKEIIPYLKRLGINSCVYCNAQYVVTLEDVIVEDGITKKWVALYQLDHFWPKSKFPFLCTTFLNLYPSCANCNLHKGNRDGYFKLYTDKESELNPLWFELRPEKIIDGVYGYKADNINIKLCGHNDTLKNKHQEYFMIEDIYKHHRKEVEETIVKLQFNDASYRRQLQKSLEELFPEGVESPERFFWGHEMDEDKVFERPFNKLVQDVVKFVK